MHSERKKLSDIVSGAGGISKLQSAWEAARAAGDRAPLPAGEYLCRVLSGELTTSRSGTPGYKLTLEVAEGDHAGRRCWHDLWLTAAAMPMTKRDLVEVGITRLEQLEEPLPAGILVRVKVALRCDDDGSERNKVTRLQAAGVEAADHFAPAADADRPDDPAARGPKGPAPHSGPAPARSVLPPAGDSPCGAGGVHR